MQTSSVSSAGGEATLRLDDPSSPEWMLLPRLDLTFERTPEPATVSLSEAVAWVHEHKPILWCGSMFSVPAPSGFPSGAAITKSILALALPGLGPVPADVAAALFARLVSKWPLESLLDEFEFLGFDLSESLLAFFADHDSRAVPNALHKAVASYYRQGLARRLLCVTTNWDSLLERALAGAGFEVAADGPGNWQRTQRSIVDTNISKLVVYHPHGSFAGHDVVCSFKQEQRQLNLGVFNLFREPTLFLGYSGYEPSLYRHLHFAAPQLWCVRDRSDFDIPLKRRLLSRPNVRTYVGDLAVLLRELHVLTDDVDLTSPNVALDGAIPPALANVIGLGLLAGDDPRTCASLVIDTLLSHEDDGGEGTARLVTFIRALINHSRNRRSHPALLPALVATAQTLNTEQLWLAVLSHLLRCTPLVEERVIDRLLAKAGDAAARIPEGERHRLDDGVFSPAVAMTRAAVYRSFLRRAAMLEEEYQYWMPGLFGSDMAALGEFTEILAFERLRVGDVDGARAWFDSAATSYYLRGLDDAASLCDSAAARVEQLQGRASNPSLFLGEQAE